jgi:purine-nucleoside phosphorylase
MTSPESWLTQRGAPHPRVAIVLGSGLGHPPPGYVEVVNGAYQELLPILHSSVPGHAHRLSIGFWKGVCVLLLSGRLHYYEGYPLQHTTALVRLVASWNIPRIILTNAAGSLTPVLKPGDLMAIRAHYMLVGSTAWKQLLSKTPNDRPYTSELLQRLSDLLQGTYAAVTGPCYETPAEVRALSECQAHAVGMSTAWEAEAAHRLGLEVVALSCITNYATGIQGSIPAHQEVMEVSRRSYDKLFYHISKMIV